MLSPAAEPPLAAHFVGVVLATIFYGITLAQAFAYYRAYTTDPRHMKLIVALLLLLDTSQVLLAITSIYGYTIRSRGDETALQYVSKPFMASMGVTSVVAFTVQMWAISLKEFHPDPDNYTCAGFTHIASGAVLSAGNAYLTTSIISLAFVALGSATTMTAKTIRNPRWDETRVSDLPAAIILASTVTCDLLIASAQAPRSRERCAVSCTGRCEQHGGATDASGELLAAWKPALRDRWPCWVVADRLGSGFDRQLRRWRRKITEERRREGRNVRTDGDHDGCRLGALLTTLTVLVINVGLLTSLDATIFSRPGPPFLFFLACPGNGTFLVPYILLSNCYVNSFLSILNSRRILRDLVENPEHFPVTFDFALDTG
ncbi:hypothetical protein DFH09DRAFT_1324436 [Mycena vulgaris]|nr:hypothetical protein DFH09DRAFT_1324436 [Mycena vulgaris]